MPARYQTYSNTRSNTFNTSRGVVGSSLVDTSLKVLLDLKADALPSGLTFSRPSAKTDYISGQLVQFASGVPAISVANGYFGENEQRTNSVRTSDCSGAVAGTPGTDPTNWAVSGTFDGLTKSVVGYGVDPNGFNYIDIRYTGTTTAAGSRMVRYESVTGIAAATGQIWTNSAYLAVVGGSITNLSDIKMVNYELNNVATVLVPNIGPDIKSELGASLSRKSLVSTLSGGATVTNVQPCVRISYPISAVVDITLRIACPQMEQGEGATSYIPTTGAAATRAADVLYATPAINATEGMLIAEYIENIDFAADRWTRAAALNDGTTNNSIEVYNAPGSTIHNLYEKSGGVKYADDYIGNSGVGSITKWGVGYSAAGISGCINGGTVVTKAVAAPVGLNLVSIGYSGFCGYSRRIQYYNVRNDAKMRALTT